MAQRVLLGKTSAGAYGFFVSKPGFDVMSANVLQMAFSSDYVHPKLVIQGTWTNDPNSAAAPFGSGASNGATQTLHTVSYGQTLASVPAVAFIATAPDWSITLNESNGGLNYLQNQWHTAILETCDAGVSVGGYWPGKNIVRDTNNLTDHVQADWFSARIIIVPRVNSMDIISNCKSSVTVKYLVLQGQ